MTCHTCHGGVLLLHGRPVAGVPILTALNLFLAWLYDEGTCILIAHNAKHICFHIHACDLVASFSEVVCAFVDSVLVFKGSFPHMPYYKQEMVSSILGTSHGAHNALADVVSLQKFVNMSAVSDTKLRAQVFSTPYMFEKQQCEGSTQKNLNSLQILLTQKIISKQTANKISACGLHLFHLQFAIQLGGFDHLVNHTF